MKVLVATEKAFAKQAVDGIRKIVEEAGHELVLLENYTDVNDLYKAVEDVDAMIVRSDKVTEKVISCAPKLKIVVRAGAGYDNLDLKACTEKNIVCMNTPGQNSNAVAELVMGLLVYGLRNHFQPGTGSECKGRSIGILAFGNVGKRVVPIAKGLGMEAYAYDAFVPKEEIEKVCHAVSSQAELFEKCDVVSLHIPLTKETRGSINYEMIMKMKKGGVIINTARKEVIDEAGLLKALSERPDLKYVTDIAPDNKEILEKYPKQTFATPKKMGAETAEANINAGLAAANQICGFFATGCTKFKVN